MKQLLNLCLLGGIILFLGWIVAEYQAIEKRKRILYEEAHANDPVQKPFRYDWQTGEYIYQEIPTQKANISFRPSLDSSHILYDENYTHRIDPELIPYFELFKNYAQKFNVSIPYRDRNIYIIFDKYLSPDEDAVAQCLKLGSTITIKIDPTFWKLKPELREVVFLHECGHCFLNRGHYDEILVINYREKMKSIMNTHVLSLGDSYEEHKLYYLRELFQGKYHKH